MSRRDCVLYWQRYKSKVMETEKDAYERGLGKFELDGRTTAFIHSESAGIIFDHITVLSQLASGQLEDDIPILFYHMAWHGSEQGYRASLLVNLNANSHCLSFSLLHSLLFNSLDQNSGDADLPSIPSSSASLSSPPPLSLSLSPSCASTSAALRCLVTERRQWALRAARRKEGPNIANQKALNVKVS